MKVYILSVGYGYSRLRIKNVFDSIEKAKKYCNAEYGTNLTDWVYSENDEWYFYDAVYDPNNTQDLPYDDFVITIKDVK